MTAREPLDLDAIEARVPTGYEGPWYVRQTEDGRWLVGYPTDCDLAGLVATVPDYGAYLAEFIAAARTDVPALVGEVRDLRAKVERDRAELTRRRTDDLELRGALWPNGEVSIVPAEADSPLTAVRWLTAEVEQITRERNETLAEVTALREANEKLIGHLNKLSDAVLGIELPERTATPCGYHKLLAEYAWLEGTGDGLVDDACAAEPTHYVQVTGDKAGDLLQRVCARHAEALEVHPGFSAVQPIHSGGDR